MRRIRKCSGTVDHDEGDDAPNATASRNDLLQLAEDDGQHTIPGILLMLLPLLLLFQSQAFSFSVRAENLMITKEGMN